MPNVYKYLLFSVLGLLIIYIGSVIQHIAIPVEQRDFSHFLNYNFTKPVAFIFFIVAFLIGYFLKLNPLMTGLFLLIIFPLTAIVESIIFKGSHSLIPAELVMYCLYALPSIIGALIGKRISEYVAKRKVNEDLAKRSLR